MGEVQFKRLNIKVGPFPIHVSEGKISFENCLVEVCSELCFTFDKRAEIDLHRCCFNSDNEFSFICLENPDSAIKMNIRDCLFEDFKVIIGDVQESQRCGLDLHVESCSFLGIKWAMISLFSDSPSKATMLTYPISVVIRNSFVEVRPSFEVISPQMTPIMNINNASHVLIESTKFISKKGDPSDSDKVELLTKEGVNTGLLFTNIPHVEIANTIVIREGNDSTLTSLRTYLEKRPTEGNLEEAAIQLSAVLEATIRDSILEGFYFGITTRSTDQVVNKFDKICFTGVYNCQLSNMAVCVLLDSRFTSRSIFALSDISLRDSLVGVKVSEACCRNGSVDVLDAVTLRSRRGCFTIFFPQLQMPSLSTSHRPL